VMNSAIATFRQLVPQFGGTNQLVINQSVQDRRRISREGPQCLGCTIFSALIVSLLIAIGLGWNPLATEKSVSANLWHLDAAVQASLDALVGPPNLEDAAHLLVVKVNMLQNLLNDTAQWPTRHQFLRHAGDRVKRLASLLTALNLDEPAELIQKAATRLDQVDDVAWTNPSEITAAMEFALNHFETLNCTHADADADILDTVDCLLTFRNMETMSRSLTDLTNRREEAIAYLKTSSSILETLHLEQWNAAAWDGYRNWASRNLPIPSAVIDEILARISPAFAGPALTHAVLAYRVIYLQYYTWQEVDIGGQEMRIGQSLSPAKFIMALLSGHGLAYVPLALQLLLVFEIGGHLNVLSPLRRWLERELDKYLTREGHAYTWTVFVAAIVRGFFDAFALWVRMVIALFVLTNAAYAIPALWDDQRASHFLEYAKAYDPLRLLAMVTVYALFWAYRLLPERAKEMLDSCIPTWLGSPHPALRVVLVAVFNSWYKESDHIPFVTSLIPFELIFRV